MKELQLTDFLRCLKPLQEQHNFTLLQEFYELKQLCQKIPFYVDNKLMVSQKILGEIKDEERKIKIEAF